MISGIEWARLGEPSIHELGKDRGSVDVIYVGALPICFAALERRRDLHGVSC
jgi:hypothetical protein